MIKEEDRERIFAIAKFVHGDTLDLDGYFTSASLTDVDWSPKHQCWVVTVGRAEWLVVTSEPGERVILHRNTNAPKVTESYQGYQALGLRPPHCDPRVLHAPDECEICDEHARTTQDDRIGNDVSFTSKTDGRWPCPADVARPNMNQVWQGNRPWRTP